MQWRKEKNKYNEAGPRVNTNLQAIKEKDQPMKLNDEEEYDAPPVTTDSIQQKLAALQQKSLEAMGPSTGELQELHEERETKLTSQREANESS